MRNILIIPLVLWTFIASAQTPEFQFTLYAENFFGHKDSVVIGYDAMAINGTDSIFGEVDITGTPFDSLMEMRVSPWHYNNLGIRHMHKQSKKEIANWHCQDSLYPYIVNRVYISIHSKYLPIRLSWDKNQFIGSCNQWTVLTEDSNFIGSWDWWFRHQFLKDAEHFIVYNDDYLFYNNDWYYGDIVGGTVDTIVGITLAFMTENKVDYGPLPTTRVEEALQAKVFPNPATNYLNIEIPQVFLDIKELMIYDATGKRVMQKNISNYEQQLDISSWSKGIYFYTIRNEAGKLIRGKFLVN